MDNTLQSYRLITRNLDRSLTLKAAEKPVALESKYYLENIGKISSIDDFLKNTRVFNFAMKAFGLEEMAFAKGYMRKVLTEGIDDPKSFANKLNDQRFVKFVTAFNFARDGATATASAEVRQPVADLYVRQSLESDEGASNDGVRLALYFQRMAPTVKSAYGLLADTALWQVVKTTFDFPDAMANAPIDKQAQAVNAQLKIADLSDPKKMDALLRRFSVKWDIAQGVEASPILALFNTSSVNLNTSLSILNLKYGG